jgi:hypothetical protein
MAVTSELPPPVSSPTASNTTCVPKHMFGSATASFVEYAERIFGYGPRLTQDKLRVAESLESLPELAQALRDREASWSSVRELTRVATSETEHAWLERARGHSAREIETRRALASRGPGGRRRSARGHRAQRATAPQRWRVGSQHRDGATVRR